MLNYNYSSIALDSVRPPISKKKGKTQSLINRERVARIQRIKITI
jgi:hypothetical protein